MRGVWRLALRQLAARPGRTALLVLCLGVTAFVPIAGQLVTARIRDRLSMRAEATPYLLGARGHRFDLTLSALYFRRADITTIPRGVLGQVVPVAEAAVIPVCVRDTAQGWPLVGTSAEYFSFRQLRADAGSLPLRVGDVVLGAAVARELGLGPGDTLFSDQRDLYDLTRPSALKLLVTGVLASTGSPDDRAAFVDAKTIAIFEGLAHGHANAADELEEEDVLGRSEEHVTVNPALVDALEVTDANVASFHVHGDPGALPLSAAIVIPRDQKAGTILQTRVNTSGDWQIVRPTDVVNEILAVVLRMKTLFDALALTLVVLALILGGLVMALALRMREQEFAVMNRIGGDLGVVPRLIACEFAVIFVLAAMVAGGAALVALAAVGRVL